jgi:TetR/AcrR family transcriptional regulator, regulator of autoinduction and epiphytic fitness
VIPCVGSMSCSRLCLLGSAGRPLGGANLQDDLVSYRNVFVSLRDGRVFVSPQVRVTAFVGERTVPGGVGPGGTRRRSIETAGPAGAQSRRGHPSGRGQVLRTRVPASHPRPDLPGRPETTRHIAGVRYKVAVFRFSTRRYSLVMTSSSRDPRVAVSKAAVMRAVTELLAERGPAGVTIDEVLSRSGVARATLYRHWPTRRALIVDGLKTLMKPPPTPTASEGTVADRLRKFVHDFAMQFKNERMALMMPILLDAGRRDPELSDTMRDLAKSRRQPLRDVIADGIAQGELVPRSIPTWLMRSLSGHCCSVV